MQLQHNDPNQTVRRRAASTLHNVVNCHAEDKKGRREIRVLKLIEQLNDYNEILSIEGKHEGTIDRKKLHPIQVVGTLMKISFDEDHRHIMCLYGAIQTLTKLIQLDHEAHGIESQYDDCIILRRYAGMTLTNLTFGDGNNKTLLCANQKFMTYLIKQVQSESDELVQVTASVIRNLSWRADSHIKKILNDLDTVKTLTMAAIKCTNENTLKAILSALWNLSNSSQSKKDFCKCNGAISFIVDMLNYNSASKTVNIIENAGGVLRNISSVIATNKDYRETLRKKNCLLILLEHLKSSSLIIVSNATGTIGNLSAGCEEDQNYLREHGAISMLKSLVSSKHRLISTGSAQALRNLLHDTKLTLSEKHLVSSMSALNSKDASLLSARKHRIFLQEFDTNCKENSCYKSLKRETHLCNITCFSDVSIPSLSFKKDFQETDVDQPTDFSKRYGEDKEGITSSEESKKAQAGIYIDEDQLKTFNTEGTPYDVSNFGSTSDLRCTSLGKGPKIENSDGIYQKIDIKCYDIHKKIKTEKVVDCLSPERPKSYCEEGTPSGFSRNDSLSDLEESDAKTLSTTKKCSMVKGRKISDFSAEQTPLMYSRTSSLGSLGSAEPICKSDDKSSVVSEFR